MPKNLSSTGLSFPAQTTPVAGEPRTGGSIETPLQNASDRTEYLKRRLDYVQVDGEGVRRFRRFASLLALKSSTDHVDGTIAFVAGVGLYEYVAASELVEASPVVITPTDVGVGAGRWVHDVYGTMNAANGVPQLDASGKLPTARLAETTGAGKLDGTSIAWGTVFFSATYLSATFNVPHDAVEREVDGSQIVMSDLQVGDIIVADYDPVIVANNAADIVLARLAVQHPTGVDYGRETQVANTLLAGSRVRVGHHYVVAVAGEHIVSLGATGSVSNVGTDTISKVNIRVEVRRP